MKKMAMISTIGLCLAVLIIAGFPLVGDAATIYGCQERLTGFVRIVSSPSQCNRFETPISWDSVGPQGPAGPPGPAGVANGITTGVHGVVNYDGTVFEGVGFSSSFASGVYYITFDQAFSYPGPHCVVTPFQSPPTTMCAIFGYGPTTLYVNCTAQVSFFFICVQ